MNMQNTFEKETSSVPAQGGFWLRNLWVMLLLAGVVVGGVGFVLAKESQTQELTAQRAQMSDLRSRIEAAQRGKVAHQDTTIAQVTGISPERVESDSRAIKEFLGLAFTWKSGEGYESVRESLIRRYKFTEKDQFISEFMPPSRFNADSSGKRYYYIDALGLTSDFDEAGARIQVLEVSGTDYHYVVMADISVSAKATDTKGTPDLTARAVRTTLVYLSVDAEGKISAVRGIPASGTTHGSK